VSDVWNEMGYWEGEYIGKDERAPFYGIARCTCIHGPVGSAVSRALLYPIVFSQALNEPLGWKCKIDSNTVSHAGSNEFNQAGVSPGLL